MATVIARPMPGGPLALDLLNTSWSGASGPVDWLASDGAVEQFLSEHHAVSEVDSAAARDALVSARALIRGLFEDPSAPLDAGLVEDVRLTLEMAKVTLVPTSDGVSTAITGDQPHTAVAVEALVDALELRRTRPDRVRCCEHQDCVLWFLDTSKGGRRRWCSMERCGNRAKAQRHYRRSTGSVD